MSGEGRPTEWMPLAILGGVILAVDLAIVVSEVISPTIPTPASSASSAPERPAPGKSQREHALGAQPPATPRGAVRAPQEVHDPSGTPRAIVASPTSPSPESPVAAPAATPPHAGAMAARALMAAPPGIAKLASDGADGGVADADPGGR
jgi:hypothetical protein